MTTDTDARLGKEPPRDWMLIDRWSDHDIIESVPMVRADNADYWRRRAERAEELLGESARWHRHTCNLPYSGYCDCELKLHQARVAAHFDEVKP